MSELRTEYLLLVDLVPAEVNPKLHAEPEIMASISRFGFVEPVLLDERTGRLVAGHGRLEALQSLAALGGAPPPGIDDAGAGWMVPVVRGWSSADDAEAAALLVAVNRLPAQGGWDKAMLAQVLAELGSLDGVGFSTVDLDDLMAELQEFVPAEVPAAPGQFDTYRNAQVRSMVFDYPLSDYAEITAIAARARPVFGVESNAELFQAMLAVF